MTISNLNLQNKDKPKVTLKYFVSIKILLFFSYLADLTIKTERKLIKNEKEKYSNSISCHKNAAGLLKIKKRLIMAGRERELRYLTTGH